jgi:acetyl-CoA carboxylase biotin carboxyl carrier protein
LNIKELSNQVEFNIKDLKNLLVSVRNNDLRYISIKQNSFELIINSKKRMINGPIQTTSYPQATKIKKIAKFPIKEPKITKKRNKEKETEMYFTIVSPMVGTFYRSPAPNESYFIELNDYVKVKQTVCIIEAMKLMNEIEAEVSGEIVEILVKDGDIIDCGQALMKIKPRE